MRRSGAAAVLLILTACLETGVEVGEPVRIRIEVEEATRALGQAHEFRVEARGRLLQGVVVDFGDERIDSIGASGAQSLSHLDSHVYLDPGSYRVRAFAEDGNHETARDSVTVHVLPPS